MIYDNREEIKSLPLIWQNLLRQYSLNLECAIPGVVEEYDREKNLVTVQPAINRMDVNKESIKRTQIIVPCFNPTGGGIGINFPLAKGDTGWLIAADRDTTTFIEKREVSDPDSGNLHRYVYGFFLPDQVSGFEIDDEDEKALVIQTLDSSTRISITSGAVIIASTDKVDVRTVWANVNAISGATVNTKSANVTATTSALLTTPIASANVTDFAEVTVANEAKVKAKTAVVSATTSAKIETPIVSGAITNYASMTITSGAIITAKTADVTATTSAKITSPVTSVNATNNATVTAGVAAVDATTSATVTAPTVKVNATSAKVDCATITITGNINLTGDISVTGGITTTDDVVAAGVSLIAQGGGGD